MEPMKFYFDVRDIFQFTTISIKWKERFGYFLKANLFGFAIYWIFIIFSYGSLSGNNFSECIKQYWTLSMYL